MRESSDVWSPASTLRRVVRKSIQLRVTATGSSVEVYRPAPPNAISITTPKSNADNITQIGRLSNGNNKITSGKIIGRSHIAIDISSRINIWTNSNTSVNQKYRMLLNISILYFYLLLKWCMDIDSTIRVSTIQPLSTSYPPPVYEVPRVHRSGYSQR